MLWMLGLALALAGPGRSTRGRNRAGADRGRRHPARVHSLRADAPGRSALPSQDAPGGGHRPRGDHALQDRLRGLQGGRRPRRLRRPPRPRVGGDRQPPRPAARFRPPGASLRGERDPESAAALPPRRLEGGLRPAGDRLRAVVVPRQHRGGAHRRRHGAHPVQQEGPYRLYRGARRGLERRRFRQRRRRHHHDDDVDPRRAADRGLPRLHRGVSWRWWSSASRPRSSSTGTRRS